MAGVSTTPFAIKQIIGRCGKWQIRMTLSTSGTFFAVEAMTDDEGLTVAVVRLFDSFEALKAFRESLERNLREDEKCLGIDTGSEVRASMWQLAYAIEQAETLMDNT